VRTTRIPDNTRSLPVNPRFSSLAFLALAACSVPAGDDAQSSTGALGSISTTPIPVLVNLHVTAGASSVTIAYTRRLAPPFTLTLTGPNGTTTLPENDESSTPGAVFTGLDPCTPYTYSILNGGTTLATGSVHTLDTGNVVCPATEKVIPSKSIEFQGAYHWRNDAVWCNPAANYSLTLAYFPEKMPGWHDFHGGGGVGYTHYWDPGAQPLPCQEQFVQVSRTLLQWDLGASRSRRTATATFQATIDAQSTSLCVNRFYHEMALTTWSYTEQTAMAKNDQGQTWGEVYPPGFMTGMGMSLTDGDPGVPLTINGSQVSVDETAAAQNGGHISGGFAVPNDGFPTPTGLEPDHSIYPEDNNSCSTGFDNPVVALQYKPMTPDTPLNCTATVNCDQFSVTCDGAPDTFEVHQNINGANVIVGTAPGSLTGSVTISGTEDEPGAPLTVCTASYGASLQIGKLTTCTTSVAVTSSVACPVTCPVCPTGYHCQSAPGSAICVANGLVSRPNP
jgi:hypothetical protein